MGDIGPLNSTEKLLNTIRNSSSSSSGDALHASQAEQSPVIDRINKKSVSAGIAIGEKRIGFSLSGEDKTTHKIELIKWACVDIPSHTHLDQPGFSGFLKSLIDDFLRDFKPVDLWSIIDTRDLKLRNITVPNLPDSKIANAALWGLRKEFDITEATEIFDFQVIGPVYDGGIEKKSVLAFTADKQKTRRLQSVFSKAGYPLTGITALPFALQNLVASDVIPTGSALVAIANVCYQHSDIVCLSGGDILLVRNIRSGAESFFEDVQDTRQVDETFPDDGLSENLEMDTESLPTQSMHQSAERLISKIVRTGDYCSHNFAENKPVDAYYFFGETDDSPAFMESARNLIPSRVETLLPFQDIFSSSLKIKPPQKAGDRNSIIPAFAASLSSKNKTPNFLYTYVQRDIETRQKKINLAIVASFIIGLLVCTGAWAWLQSAEKAQIAQTGRIEKTLAVFSPAVTQDELTLKIKEAQSRADQAAAYQKTFLPLAVVNEVCSLTPQNIFLTALDADFTSGLPDKKTSRQKEDKQMVMLSGVVKADKRFLESTLTGYVLQLGDSPFFKDVVVEDKKIDSLGDEDALIFTAVMELL